MGIIEQVEAGKVPDLLSRAGMRAISRLRLWEEGRWLSARRSRRQTAQLAELRSGPIAVNTADANAQHYMVPAAFFKTVLGPQLKYSCGYYESAESTLAEAESAMLALTVKRACVVDGMELLDLGCGWGSLSIYLARQFPASKVMGVSNSEGQRAFIEDRAAAQGLTNLEIVTADINEFDTDNRFDRILSVEMFEHMSNYEQLLRNVRHWLSPEGKVFVHYFCHRELTYPFLPQGKANWMARHFFTGGIMPSFALFEHFSDALQVEHSWWLPGHHYERTSNNWLAQLDANREELLGILQPVCGAQTAIALERWRMFFMAVAEMFGLSGGREWGVGHYLLAPVERHGG